jgi:hypothetical protein
MNTKNPNQWTSPQTLALFDVAHLKTASALEERLETGRFDDLLRWLGSHQSAVWLKRPQAQVISRKLLEVVYEAINEGIEPCTDQDRIRGGAGLVTTLGVTDRTIRTISRLLEGLLDVHGLSAKRLNEKALKVRALRRRFKPWEYDEEIPNDAQDDSLEQGLED